eukprot:TRINITY_DN1338_c0_g1_i1.p1 TRINITY_DN1338_c0_g1~~TRINITY_DN1338_c0_g1_i1.p1  ORF type:complete len:643 (+),score=174.63 TRINITY_DN1338_c0_g1_i1:213-2141(+)
MSWKGRLTEAELDDVGRQMVSLASLDDGTPRFVFSRQDSPDGVESFSDKMKLKDYVGGGAYGMVARCYDRLVRRNVAIKRIEWDTVDREVRRVIREVQILRHVQHQNLISLAGLYTHDCESNKQGADGAKPFHLFIVCQLMDEPLSQLIQDHVECWNKTKGEKGFYSVKHLIYLIHQMLHGLFAMHSAGLVHRDIKPLNMLVNLHDSSLRICDFGLSRASQHSERAVVTHYVVTRYYRAPEIVFGMSSVETNIDIWAVGAVCAELMIGDPLFAIDSTTIDGRYNGQRAGMALLIILNRIGKPNPEDIEAIPHSNVRQYLSKIIPSHLAKGNVDRDVQEYIKKNMRLCGIPDPPEDDKIGQLLDLIDQMLQFNPAKRPSARELLDHPVFSHFDVTIKGCPLFDLPDPTDYPDFTKAKGFHMLREEAAKEVQDDGLGGEYDEDSDEEDREPIISFLSLSAKGQTPPRVLWETVLEQELMLRIIARAAEELGFPPSLDAFLALDAAQLRQLSGLVATALQQEAVNTLAHIRADPASRPLFPADVTVQNAAALQPAIYGNLATPPPDVNLTEDLADRIRYCLEILVQSLGVHPLHPAGAALDQQADEVDWSAAHLDAADDAGFEDDDMDVDWDSIMNSLNRDSDPM